MGIRRQNPAGNTSAASKEQNLTLITLFFTLFELAIGIWCAWQQMTTTHDSIFGLLQSGVITPSHATAQQIVMIMTSAEDKDNKIAYSIAFVTQAVFLSFFLPGGGMIHSPTLRKIVAGIFFVLEITSDLWYSVATGTTLLGAFTWVFNWENGGWLAAFCYIVAMSAGSTLLVIDAFHRLERLFKFLTANRAPATN